MVLYILFLHFIDNLCSGSIGSLLLLSGPQGVAYVELPNNLSGPEAQQQGTHTKIAK